MIRRVVVVGTGLIGASVGMALRGGPEVLGWDANAEELAVAVERGAVDRAVSREELLTPGLADVYVLATPVLPILDWMERLSSIVKAGQMVTDVGSTKFEIAQLAGRLYGEGGGGGVFLPGHPMAGKESGGAALAEAGLFRGATWLFTPVVAETEVTVEWRALVAGMGATGRDMDAAAHDAVCAWVSHLPQMVSTALAATLEDMFAGDAEKMAAVQAIGGRALRETTRLGASPYSMWRDVALTNTENVAATLLALEQRLQHMRENLRGPELREEFRRANRFRAVGVPPPPPPPEKHVKSSDGGS